MILDPTENFFRVKRLFKDGGDAKVVNSAVGSQRIWISGQKDDWYFRIALVFA